MLNIKIDTFKYIRQLSNANFEVNCNRKYSVPFHRLVNRAPCSLCALSQVVPININIIVKWASVRIRRFYPMLSYWLQWSSNSSWLDRRWLLRHPYVQLFKKKFVEIFLRLNQEIVHIITTQTRLRLINFKFVLEGMNQTLMS